MLKLLLVSSLVAFIAAKEFVEVLHAPSADGEHKINVKFGNGEEKRLHLRKSTKRTFDKKSIPLFDLGSGKPRKSGDFKRSLDLFEDRDNGVAAYVQDGKLTAVGPDFSIQPLIIDGDEMIPPSELQNAHLHKKQELVHPEGDGDLRYPPIVNNFERDNVVRHSKKAYGKPKAYVETFVVADYQAYKVHGYDINKFAEYAEIFYHAVQMRYDTLKKTEVNFYIAGIGVVTSQSGQAYIKSNTFVDNAGLTWVHSDDCLTAFSKYMYTINNDIPQHDIAVLQTAMDIDAADYRDSAGSVAGIAYSRGSCGLKNDFGADWGVTIVEDKGGFDGFMTATHEIAHLLGVTHDADAHPFYKDVPAADSCPWSDGFLMSYVRAFPNSWFFSECSENQLEYFLSIDESACVRGNPKNYDNNLSDKIPGDVLDVDQMCKLLNGETSEACFHDERNCEQLFCINPANGNCWAIALGPEGISCGEGKRCMNAQCIAGDAYSGGDSSSSGSGSGSGWDDGSDDDSWSDWNDDGWGSDSGSSSGCSDDDTMMFGYGGRTDLDCYGLYQVYSYFCDYSTAVENCCATHTKYC